MKDARGTIIYVGKAANLRVRVRQYFHGHDSRPQVAFLIAKVSKVDFIQTHTEREALLLENSLIKKHQPRYNVIFKDDRSYLGLRLSLRDAFPRLTTTRKFHQDGAQYFGPFTSALSLYEVKDFIDRFFKLRSCSDHEFAGRTRPCLEYQIKRCSAPCVGYVSQEDYARQIESVRLFLSGKSRELERVVQGEMAVAVEKEDFEEAARLRDLLAGMAAVTQRQQVMLLPHEVADVLALARRGAKGGVAILMVRDGCLIDSRYVVVPSHEDDEEFLRHFLLQNYHDNAFIPSEILVPFALPDAEVVAGLLSERAGRRVRIRCPRQGSWRELLELAKANLSARFDQVLEDDSSRQHVLEGLKQALFLPALPERIECYDISHISGTLAVGSLVTFQAGLPCKDGYRRFRVKTLSGPNDYAMMREVLTRRFLRDERQGPRPALVIVDGGKGQLGIALKVLAELNLTGIGVIGIAKGQGPGSRARGLWAGKKEEEIYLPGRKNPLKLRRGSAELMLLQQIRDEAHRFAIAYHRRLREQRLTRSWLDDVPGIGPKRKRDMIRAFGSPAGVAAASEAALCAIHGITPELAALVRAAGKEPA